MLCGMSRGSSTHRVIEYPAQGKTYPSPGESPYYGVYEYGTYEESSVLAGQQKRSFLDRFDSLEEAQHNYPDAQWHGENYTEYQEPYIPKTPPSWFNPDDIGEVWDDE